MDEVAWIEARTLDIETARETFALAARHVLADTAGEYHAVITVADLADAVQERTRIRTRQAASQWLGDVLYRVAKACHGRREPLLGALCVGPDGRMSDWYADTVATVRGDTITDAEQHAAEERLDCYRVHGAELPPGGGEPALPPRREPARRVARTTPASRGKPPAARRTATARRPEPAPAPLCPTCFMVLPSTGVCDNCD